jgi:hypothetical protein
MIEYILLSWVLTVIIEALILWFFLKSGPIQTLAYSAIINAISLPLAIYTYQYILGNIFVVEVMVIVIEWFLIKAMFQVNYKKALILSVVVNLVTAIVGQFLPAFS